MPSYDKHELLAGARIMATGVKLTDSFLEKAITDAAQQVGPLASEVRNALGE